MGCLTGEKIMYDSEQIRQHQEKVVKIINAASLETGVKDALRESLLALAEHENAVLEELRRRIARESRPSAPEFQVVTALIPNHLEKDLNKKGLYAVPGYEYSLFPSRQPSIENMDLNSYPKQTAGPFFLGCALDEVNGWLNEKYRVKADGREVLVRLRPHKSYETAERMLYRIARLYKIDQPIIFSPYARRGVDICCDEWTEGTLPENIDFSGTALADKVLTDYKLMWNVKIKKDQDYYSSSNAPDGKDVIYRYVISDNISRDSFILPAEENDDEKLEINDKDEHKISVVSRQNIDPFKYDLLTVSQPEDLSDLPIEVFNNSCDVGRLHQHVRLRTQGDVEAVLKAFNCNGYSCMFDSFGRKKEEVKVLFRSHDSAWYDRAPGKCEEFLRARNLSRPVCYVQFKAPDRYLSDWVDFVLDYLEYKFPEFRWAGVKSEISMDGL